MTDRAARVVALARRGGPLLVAAVTFAAFLPSVANDFVLWDDDMNFLENPAYRGLSWRHVRWAFTTTLGGHWQPLAWLTLGLDWTLWGMDARGYHLTSLVLHVGNAVWCVLFARALLARALPGASAGAVAGGAAVAGLLFAVHPLRVESVAWASERRDVLATFFWLPALLAYVRMTAAHGRARLAWGATSVACLVLSLMSKAWGVTFAAVLLVLDAYPLRRLGREPLGGLLLEKLAWVVPALVAALVMQSARPDEATRTLVHHGVTARLAQAAYGLCFYAWKTVVPLRLHPAYLLELQLDPTRPVYLAAIAAVALAAVTLVVLRRRVPWLAAAAVASVVIVSPVLGFLQTGPQIAADRYTYLAAIPWAVLAGGVVIRAAHTRPAATTLVLAVLVTVLAGLTSRQTRVWHDSVTLWDHVLRLDPANFVAWTNRGFLTRDPARAAAHYTEAIRLNPRYTLAWSNRAAGRHALGDYDGAVADYTAALALSPGDPKLWNDRGWSRQAKGDWRGAAEDYGQALARAPAGWEGRMLIETNLGIALRRLGATPGLTGRTPGP